MKPHKTRMKPPKTRMKPPTTRMKPPKPWWSHQNHDETTQNHDETTHNQDETTNSTKSCFSEMNFWIWGWIFKFGDEFSNLGMNFYLFWWGCFCWNSVRIFHDDRVMIVLWPNEILIPWRPSPLSGLQNCLLLVWCVGFGTKGNEGEWRENKLEWRGMKGNEGGMKWNEAGMNWNEE